MFPPHRRHHKIRMYIILEVWHMPLGFKMYRPLALLILTVGEVMIMEQVLHLDLMLAWSAV